MQQFLSRTNAFFDRPLTLSTRILVLIATLMLAASLFLPLWNMTFISNQYRDGLVLQIYSHKLEGGKTPERDDLREINSLNHYIGMRPLIESDFSEFTWMPFVIGALALLTLRAVVIGKMAGLVDVLVLFTYFGLFSLWSFQNRLYMYGHKLDPTAAIKVQPFTPPFFGTKTIANFTVSSFPNLAAFAMTAFVLFLVAAIYVSRKPASSS
jgi:copper chaperone NosL